jgi:hypothetical protein
LPGRRASRAVLARLQKLSDLRFIDVPIFTRIQIKGHFGPSISSQKDRNIMKTAIKLAALATLAVATSMGAQAAETADLAVRGTIRPSACNVAISTSAINLGTVSARTLSDTATTTLPGHNFSVTMTCDAATRVGLKSFDGRTGTVQTAARTALVCQRRTRCIRSGCCERDEHWCLLRSPEC